MARLNNMTPINPVLWVTGEDYELLPSTQIQPERVGEKAFGLASLPSKWTLPFFVVSDAMLKTYKTCKALKMLEDSWGNGIIKAAEACGIKRGDEIIVRSNAGTEGLSDRGKYISAEGKLEAWPKLIKDCFDDLVAQECEHDIFMPLIIQKKVTPLLRGHVSNERRVAEEIRDWRGEFEITPPQVFAISIRKWRSEINVNNFIDTPLNCSSDSVIQTALLIPCTWATNQKLRIHFEWIFDGDYIYLVQADVDTPSAGVDPHKIVFHNSIQEKNIDSVFPRCMHLLTEADYSKYSGYSKVQNPLLYQKLGLTIAPLYILDDAQTLNQLYKGTISKELESDLKFLTQKSLIIRTDINTSEKNERQLLPRTSEIRNLDAAKQWLKTEYKKLKDDTSYNIIFIFHNFIPAFSSAFAYAGPNEKDVKIEALWGVPEGLYYYSHDKYVVDTKAINIKRTDIDAFEITSFKNYKKYFVHPMPDGNWEVQTLANPYDWKGSIPEDSWVKEIAYTTRLIADTEGKSVSVMWFVGVCSDKYNCNVFPWYHEEYKYKETKTTPRNKLSFERTLTIHTLTDLEGVETKLQKGYGTIKNILVQPTDAQILRDKKIIDRIGEVAQALGANIILEGGILSHAYYQLLRTGAKVEVRNPFEKAQSISFNKLVRDKIPQKIKNNGEEVVTAQIENDILLQLLKRKLVEEALEVFDSSDRDDISAEIADVLEVLDGIKTQMGISQEEIQEKKEQKKEKAGGFEKGVYLKRTSNPMISNAGSVIVDSGPIDIKQHLSKSTDLRKYATANESFTRIKVPITMQKWEVRPTVKNKNIDIVLKGERKQGIMQIEVSVFQEAEQLSLFEK